MFSNKAYCFLRRACLIGIFDPGIEINSKSMLGYKIHVCGTHERTIAKYGLRSILPKNIEVISGPGCPVCVTPEEDINIAIALAKSGVTVVTFGDMMRVPGSAESLLDAKSEGANVKMVYSIDDAIALAEKKPELEVVFFGIGFETTVPANAAALLRKTPENFSLLTSQKQTPPAVEFLARDADVDAFIAPGHGQIQEKRAVNRSFNLFNNRSFTSTKKS